MNAAQLLVDKLLSLGATLNNPATSAEITTAESTLQCRFPDGIHDFFVVCDGVSDATSDWIWDFFSLNALVERTAERRKAEYFLTDSDERLAYRDLVAFCDVLIDAPTYLFCGNPSNPKFGKFYADQGCDGWKVADSFEDFVQLFLSRNDDVLLMPPTK